MKKALKVGLALLAASSMASSAYAEMKVESTGKVTGNATAALVQTKEAKKPVVRSFEGNADFGYEASKKVGSWTAKGSASIVVKDDGTLEADDRFVSLANDDVEVKMGYFSAGDPTKGPGYTGWVDKSLGVGDNLTGGQGTFKVSATKLGVAFSIGSKINEKETKSDAKVEEGYAYAGTRKSGYKEDTYAIHYGKKFGTIDLGLNYATAKRISDRRLGGVAYKNDENDGYTASDMGLGVGVSFDDMTVKFNYGLYNTKDNTTKATVSIEDNGTFSRKPGGNLDLDNKMSLTTMAFAFDMKLGEGGVSAYYGTQAKKTTLDMGSASGEIKVDICTGGLAYQMKVGGIPLTVGYATKSKKTKVGKASAKNPEVTSKFGVDLKYAF